MAAAAAAASPPPTDDEEDDAERAAGGADAELPPTDDDEAGGGTDDDDDDDDDDGTDDDAGDDDGAFEDHGAQWATTEGGREERSAAEAAAANAALLAALPPEQAERRRNVTTEVLETEAAYVQDLETLVQVFLYQLRGTRLVEAAECAAIFGNIELLHGVNSALLADLQAEAASRPDDPALGRVFLATAPYLKVYTEFCSAAHEAQATVARLQRERRDLARWLRDQRRQLRGLGLEDFLIKPMQRITKYPLLLQELLKVTPEAHSDHAALRDATAEVRRVASHVNDNKRLQESMTRIVTITQTMADAPKDLDLIGPTRRFRGEGRVLLLPPGGGNGRGDVRLATLFNDLLLLRRPRRKGRSTYVAHVRLHEAELRDVEDVPDGASPAVLRWTLPHTTVAACNSFVVTDTAARRSYVLSVHKAAEKTAWLRALAAAVAEAKEVHRRTKANAPQVRSFARRRTLNMDAESEVNAKRQEVLERHRSKAAADAAAAAASSADGGERRRWNKSYKSLVARGDGDGPPETQSAPVTPADATPQRPWHRRYSKSLRQRPAGAVKSGDGKGKGSGDDDGGGGGDDDGGGGKNAAALDPQVMEVCREYEAEIAVLRRDAAHAASRATTLVQMNELMRQRIEQIRDVVLEAGDELPAALKNRLLVLALLDEDDDDLIPAE